MRTVRKGISARTVDEYLAKVPDRDRPALERLRRTIRAAAPQAEELMSYKMPAYRWKGPVVFFAWFEGHLSLFGVSRPLLGSFKEELEAFEISGTTIHFSADHPLPDRLVKRLVKARIEQNEARAKGKKER